LPKRLQIESLGFWPKYRKINRTESKKEKFNKPRNIR